MLKNADYDHEDERNVMIIQILYMSITVISYLDLVTGDTKPYCYVIARSNYMRYQTLLSYHR